MGEEASLAPHAASKEGKRVKGPQKFLVGFIICLGGTLVFLAFFGHRDFYQAYRLRQERLRLEQENARLAEDNARLARTIDRLENDPEMIQDLIRRELNFVRKNEIILQLTPTLPGNPTGSVQKPPARIKPLAGAGAGPGVRVRSRLASPEGAPGREAAPGPAATRKAPAPKGGAEP